MKKTVTLKLGDSATKELRTLQEQLQTKDAADTVVQCIAFTKSLCDYLEEGYEVAVIKRRWFGHDKVFELQVGKWRK